MKSIVILFLFLTLFCTADSYKGLFIMPSGPKSHMNFFDGIIDALVSNGHEITFISTHTPSIKSPHLHQIRIEDFERRTTIGNTFRLNALETVLSYTKFIPLQCLRALTNPDVQKALEHHYDYVMVSLFYSDCFLAYIYKSKMPLIYVFPNAMVPPYSEKLGAPEFSFTPNRALPMAYPLSFLERVVSTLVDFLFKQLIVHLIERRTERMCREQNLWDPDTPPIEELHKLSSLVIINSVRALEYPVKSTPPAVIYAGGIHIKTSQSLPEELENWISESGEDGFILFSLGTAIQPADITKENLEILLNVFKSLKQRILWKWNADTIDNVPKNVRLSSWVPQQEVLAHPKLKLFITHGGLFSLIESSYYGVPVVGMPVFADQKGNMAGVVQERWGLQVLWTDLTKTNFQSSIVEVLTNNSYRLRVQERSERMKDWPTKPKDDVVFWINYVVRHNGAKHLQSPLVHLTWYEIYNLDAWLFILAMLVLVLIIIYYIIKLIIKSCLKLCIRRKHKTD